MAKVRARGEAIRKFIVSHVEAHPGNIAGVTAELFDITRQAANKHLRRLVDEGVLEYEGETRSRKYRLVTLSAWSFAYDVADTLTEDAVWRSDIRPRLAHLSDSALRIWQYGVTEMFNNAIDHAQGKTIKVAFAENAAMGEMWLTDDGVGIFRKIQAELGLDDERHAVLELAKGKLTTDPETHSGQGIFFTSRMFDDFVAWSGGVHFSHQFGQDEDLILDRRLRGAGTVVKLRLAINSTRTAAEVFDQFASADVGDYGFTKTIVPVRLAEYGDDKLVSRSQAKRLLVRFDRFKTVVLDFSEVDEIGQAFADEVFRVFPNQHPDVQLVETNANSAVTRMISRARSTT